MGLQPGTHFYFTATEPWEYFDCPITQNTSHMAGAAAALQLGFAEKDVFVW